jgi:DNA topoisomerase-1
VQLVIVESPKKARTIGKLLGPGFRVEASYGHVRDLPPKRLGVAVEEGFRPEWEPVPRARTRLAALRKAASGAERIVLATDPDREGEAIAWHVADALRLRSPTRVVFHAITAGAVRAAFQSPRQLDQRLVEAQQARRVLDRLVGYQVSPLLWRKIARGTSAGRVQSVALRLVVEREREIRAFMPREYWTIDARLCPADREGDQFVARLVKIGRDDAEIPDRAAAERLVADLERASYRVAAQATRIVERTPPPPFTTSTLQQAAAGRLRLSGKRTMQLAQSLYEAGLITYHRTDAVRVEPEAIEAARALIAERFGREYLPERPRHYANRVKNAQEAHEAIRPADPGRAPESLPAATPSDERALYRLIWQRFVASQAAPARYSRRTVDVEARAEGSYLLRAGATTLLFPGYLAVYGAEPGEHAAEEPGPTQGVPGTPAEAANERLPELRDGEALRLLGLDPRQHFTKPPPRFSEPALIKELERAGVGRPSTYATIVGTLEERGYVEREKGFFVPTELGMAVNDFVVSFFPTVADVGFTAQLEDGLDAVARGEQGWQALLTDFYRPFRSALEVAGRAVPIATPPARPVGPAGAEGSAARPGGRPRGRPRAAPPDPLTRRTVGPRQRARRPAPATADGEGGERPVGEHCPLCGRPMVERQGPYSTFLGCTGFPACRGTVKLEPRASGRPGKSRSRRRSRGR